MTHKTSTSRFLIPSPLALASHKAVTMVLSFELFVTLILVASLIFFIGYSIFWYINTPKHLPPGPAGFPLIGCLPYIQPTTAHLTLEKWSKKYGGLMSFYMGNTLVVVLGDYETIREALVKQGDLFNGRNVIRAFRARGVAQGLGLTGAEGDIWREQRGFCLKTLKEFGAGRSILEPKIRHEVQFLLDGIGKRDGCPIDLKMILHYAVSNVVVQLVFGKRFDYDDPQYISYLEKTTFRLTESGINAMSSFNFFPWLIHLQSLRPRVGSVVRDTDVVLNFIRRFIREKELALGQYEEPDDYMSAFLSAQKNGDGQYFHHDQLLIAVQQLFIAGSETSATVLRWAVWYMAKYGEYQARVYKEIVDTVGPDHPPMWTDRAKMPFTQATLCEIMRICNLSPMAITHRTLQDTSLMGYYIPKNAYVIPFLWAVHLNPKYFPNPKEFRPERFIDQNGQFIKHQACIPFSLGKRTCLGESLAKMELFIFFTAMIQRFRFRFADNGKNEECPGSVVGVVISPAPFHVIAESRV